MKLNYKPITKEVWKDAEKSVWHSVKKFYVKTNVWYSVWDSIRNHVLYRIQDSIDQTLKEHNETKL